MEYNKLVRDKIPEIIKSQGEAPVTRTLEDGEYLACLEQKLREETGEYLESGELDELADILEVVFALSQARGHSRADLEAAYERKHRSRGGFEQRIFLISKS